MQSTEIRIGTRGSPLALAQANETRRRLAETLLRGEEQIRIIPIRTSGDRITDRPLIEAGGKGLFTKEIDEALLAGSIDLAVHSAKDMPTAMPDGLVIAACLPREDVRDAFLSPIAASLGALPRGAVIGTSSLRRKAMALRSRPDLEVVDLRGNVETRLKKLDEGVAAATMLAAAGLSRLGLLDRAAGLIAAEEWLPAAGQGTIAIVARAGDETTRERLGRLNHMQTALALAAERAYLAVLDGSCRTPIGALARVEDGKVDFRGIIIRPDGSAAHETRRQGAASDAARIGAEAAAELKTAGGSGFF